MSESQSIWRRMFNGWMAITARFGHVQTLMLLVIVYGMLFGPIGLGFRLTGRDFLSKRGLRGGGSAWHEAESTKPDLERAKLLS